MGSRTPVAPIAALSLALVIGAATLHHPPRTSGAASEAGVGGAGGPSLAGGGASPSDLASAASIPAPGIVRAIEPRAAAQGANSTGATAPTNTTSSTATEGTSEHASTAAPSGTRASAAGCTTVSGATQYSTCGPDGSVACLLYQTPAALFGTLTGWRCSVEVGTGADLAMYTVQHSCAGLARSMTCRPETIRQATELLAAGGCPGPVTGTISGSGNRIRLEVRIVGPAGSRVLPAILDTGGVDTQLPNADMKAVGYTPLIQTTGSWPLVSQRPVAEWLYDAPYPQISDHGAWVPLGFGTMAIHGTAVPAGVPPLVGPDILKAGTRLSTDGSTFTLTPPCPPHQVQ